MDLMSLTAVELGKKIQAKEVTVEEAVKAAIASIKAKEEKINSFVTIDEEGALKKAAEVQAKIDAGELKGALAGVPVAIKDNMCTKGLLTTCSSKILYNFIPTYTAEAVKRLEDAGCVIVGKTNMDEFAMGSTTDFMTCAGRTLPDNILLWARRNLAVARSSEVSPEERRHAQRALSIMMNIQWKGNYFEAIDPVEARRILDEELYGMESVKQRIIETIIQINRTHTLPAYGLLLCGPAGTGKSQIAYAVARILKLPWTTLDMSSINDAEQLTGSSRIYSNAKPGIIMEAFSQAGESNLVFIINELDKASSKNGNGNPADVLLTLLDNLGFTDNYMECMVPTVGVYPIATANDKSQISAPLMSRFAVIDIPDYTDEEKKVIFQRFALRKVFERMGMKEEECVLTEDGLDAVIKLHENTSGIRDLEQAAEHLAANALYQIEVDKVKQVVFDAEAVFELLG